MPTPQSTRAQAQGPIRGGISLQPSVLDVDEVAKVALEHADAERDRQLEPLMATMVKDPLFEFHPPGSCLYGGDTIRRYYVQFLAKFMPLVEDATRLGEWVNTSAAVHEYSIDVRVGGAVERHHLTSVLYVSGDRLGGERLYGSGRLLRLMLDEMFDELQPLVDR